jgi:hypothetical protein
VPLALVTVMGWLPAPRPVGVVAVICVLLLTVKEALATPKRTVVVPVKLVPVMVMLVATPCVALAGLALVTVGTPPPPPAVVVVVPEAVVVPVTAAVSQPAVKVRSTVPVGVLTVQVPSRHVFPRARAVRPWVARPKFRVTEAAPVALDWNVT